MFLKAYDNKGKSCLVNLVHIEKIVKTGDLHIDLWARNKQTFYEVPFNNTKERDLKFQEIEMEAVYGITDY